MQPCLKMLTDCKAVTLLSCGHDGVAAGICVILQTLHRLHAAIFGSCAGSLRFLKSLQSILGPKYHLKSYIIRPISVLYLCGTNVHVPVWQSCDGSNYMSSQRPTASQFLKICHSQELIVDATAPVNEYIN